MRAPHITTLGIIGLAITAWAIGGPVSRTIGIISVGIAIAHEIVRWRVGAEA